MNKPELTLADLNKAIAMMEQPLYCKHCNKEIQWDGSQWFHIELGVQHKAESWSKVLSWHELNKALNP